jgi:hypothetical protein
MGREAVCRCELAGEQAEVKVQLEGPELILRGVSQKGLRRRIPIADLAGIAVRGGRLTFSAGKENVALELGEAQAARWAKTLATPPPALAAKLGIGAATRVLLLGRLGSTELETAVAQAAGIKDAPGPGVNLVIASVREPGELEEAAGLCSREVPGGVPVWIVYPKGRGHAVSEADVRRALLAVGFVDTKVASISAAHTGLKFSRRKKGA